jgi:hypothetical protein
MSSIKGRNVSPLVGWGILIVILAGVCWMIKGQVNETTVAPTPDSSTTKTTPLATASAESIEPVTDAGVTWLAEPEKLGDLNLLKQTEDPKYQIGPTVYFKVGTDNGKDIVVASYPSGGIGGNYSLLYLLVKNNDGGYDFLTHHSVTATGSDKNNYGGVALTGNAKINDSKIYKSIEIQPTLKINNITFTNTNLSHLSTSSVDSLDSSDLSWFPEVQKSIQENKNVKFTKYASTPYGDLYRETTTQSDNLLNQYDQFLLKRFDNRVTEYQVRPTFIKDDGVPQITWNDGTVNKLTYRYDGSGGCGVYYAVVYASSLSEKDLTSAGKTSTGETIYEFKDKNHPIIQELHKAIVDKDGKPTIEEYVAGRSVFVYKDKLDRFIIFNGGKYIIQAECGKPVVYLYPTEKTDVSVAVGAEVTVSEPNYGNGWKVTARPNGQLTNSDGKTYDSLFWEGLGKGIYPKITSGFVVAQKDVASTMRQHLSQLGLNEKESADFMEFWLPKMPTTPYVRLSWLGTRDMDRLAPLTVEPKPDTSIRIFLDFAGLEKPINLPEQKLSTIPRRGFTLVEWGGLLVK